MRALATGGAGFIGSHVVDAYVGRHDVVIVDNLSTGKGGKHRPPRPSSTRCDLFDDKLQALMKDENVKVVNHHAAQIKVKASMETAPAAIQYSAAPSPNVPSRPTRTTLTIGPSDATVPVAKPRRTSYP